MANHDSGINDNSDNDNSDNDIANRDKLKRKHKSIPTIMEVVAEPPPDIDLDLLDIPILTDKVEVDADTQSSEQAAEQENPSDHQQEESNRDQ